MIDFFPMSRTTTACTRDKTVVSRLEILYVIASRLVKKETLHNTDLSIFTVRACMNDLYNC